MLIFVSIAGRAAGSLNQSIVFGFHARSTSIEFLKGIRSIGFEVFLCFQIFNMILEVFVD